MFKKFENINNIIHDIRHNWQILSAEQFCEYYNTLGYYFPTYWSGVSKDFIALSLPKEFIVLRLQNTKEYKKIALILNRRVKFVSLKTNNGFIGVDDSLFQDYPLYIELKFTLNDNDEGLGVASISHKEKEEVIRLFNAIQESCISLNLNPIIEKLC